MRRAVMMIAALLGAILLGAGLWLYTPDKPRAELEAAYAGQPSSFVSVLGLRLQLRDTGPRDAQAVVLLHGFGSNLHTWDAWATDLERDHRVIRFDLPGFGLTGADPTGDYSDARSIGVLVALFDALHLLPVTLIGNSMGGRIAWVFAAAHPERVAKLVLISPDGFASPGFAYNEKQSVPLLMRLLPYVLPTPMLRGSLQAAYADPTRMKSDTLRLTRDMLLAPGVRSAILARMEQVVLVDPEPLLRRVTAPTLLLWGQQDAMIPFSNAKDYLAALPHAKLAPLPGIGHVPQEEAAENSVRLLRAFIDD